MYCLGHHYLELENTIGLNIMEDRYIISIDLGTTNVKACIFDFEEGRILNVSRISIPKVIPRPEWIEQDPVTLWKSALYALKDVLNKSKISIRQVEAIGLANQRGSIVAWDKRDGKPLYNVIVWQCRRTDKIVQELAMTYKDLIKKKTGLVPSSNFSYPKIRWLFENIPKIKEGFIKGEIAIGTLDTYFLWKLSGENKVFATDYTNASRTMLFNIWNLDWDDELLDIFGIPKEHLPEIRPSGTIHGYTDKNILGAEIPIACIIGDQQAALFGQLATLPGMVKCTYGTGSFVLMNIGNRPIITKNLITTIAWSYNKYLTYALEGSMYASGTLIEWLINNLGLASSIRELESMARSSGDNVFFIPAILGLGAPYWNNKIKAMFLGLNITTKKHHLVRAVYESIVFMIKRIIEEMEKDSKIKMRELRVDGGLAKSDILLQLQANILGTKVVRPQFLETTLLGSIYMVCLAMKYYKSFSELEKLWKIDKEFHPEKNTKHFIQKYIAWKKVLETMISIVDSI